MEERKKKKQREVAAAKMNTPEYQVRLSPSRIPVIGFIARGTQWLNFSMRGSMARA